MLADLNWVAILLGTIGYMALGFIWYATFSTVWMDAMGMTGEELEGESPMVGYLITTAGSFIAVVALALLVVWIDASTWQEGLTLGAVVGVGLVATTSVQAVPFEGRSWTLYTINAGYNVVALSGISVLLALW